MYRIGDILRGFFPRSDGQRGAHFAMVTELIGPYAVVVIGTSQKVGLASAGGRVVLRETDVEPRAWQATGLSKPTGFDFAGGRLVPVGSTPGKYQEELVGSAAYDPMWRTEIRRQQPIVSRRVASLIAQRPR